MNRLRELRKERGLTLDDIEEELGIGRATYNNYENGKTSPKLKTLVKMAEFYGVTIDYMLGVDRTQCTDKADDESNSEYLTDLYDLKYCQYCGEIFKYCPYCGRKL